MCLYAAQTQLSNALTFKPLPTDLWCLFIASNVNVPYFERRTALQSTSPFCILGHNWSKPRFMKFVKSIHTYFSMTSQYYIIDSFLNRFPAQILARWGSSRFPDFICLIRFFSPPITHYQRALNGPKFV